MKKIIFIILCSPIISYSLTLDEAIDKSLKNNYYMKSLSNQTEQLKYQKQSKESANMPSFILEGSYTMLDEDKYTIMDMPGPLPDKKLKFINKNSYKMFAGANYNLYTGGIVSSQIRTKENEFKSSSFHLKEEKIKLEFQVKTLFIKILELQSIKQVNISQIETLKSHLKDIENFYKKGLVADIDLMQTRIKLKESVQQLAEIQKQINILKSQLSIIMGDEVNSDYQLNEVDKKIEKLPNFNTLKEIAKKNRPLVKQLKYKINATKELENLSKSGFLPKIYLKGGYQYSNEMNGIEPEGSFMLQTGVNITLNWDKPFNDIKASKQALYQVENIKRNALLQISLQVKRAYENYQTAVSNHKVAISALDEAKEYFRITKLKYANGLSSNTDVLDAETMLTNAKANEKKSFYRILNAYFSIESAIGTKIKGETNE